ncbi:MAG: adenosylcobinamide-GDP ribazoletransferase [Armatimonadetes bacterium]|nr:adenosylcobinamide-GDP ribazoletransferase [Armatimonadota bacterium]
MPAASCPAATVRRFVLAVRFLTRLPMPGPDIGHEELGKAAAYFPMVGLVVGAPVAAAAAAVASLWGDPLLGGAAAVVANAVITGGLHLDGLMDTCDGLFGGHTRERALEIMRDPRVGSFGVLGGGTAILVRSLLSAGSGTAIPWQGILLAPVVGRCALVWTVASFPYARPEGTGKAFSGATGGAQWGVAAAWAAALCAAVAGVPGLAWLGAGWLVAAGVGWGIRRRLGGLTGDSYGAVTEVAEWVALAAAGLVPGAGCPLGAALNARL